MKKIFFVFVLLFLFTLNFMSCSKDSPSEPKQELTFGEKLQNALDNGLESFNGKGVSAAVIKPDGEIWSGVSGVSHGTMPITPDMLFGTGSMGKMFTAVTILELVEEGLLSLDDSLHEWLPVYPNIDSTINIRQLLNHTSGLPNPGEHPDYVTAMFAEPMRFWTPEETITSFTVEPLFPKGTDWHYSNINYILLGMIIEQVTGSEIATVFRNRLFDPLNLNGTYFAEEEAIVGTMAHAWFDLDGDGNLEDISSFPITAIYSTGWTAGAQFSTAEDLANWSHALFYNRNVLSQPILDQMLTFHSPCTGEEFLAAGYGLGVTKFQPGLFNNLVVWGHGGDGFGYTAFCLYLPNYGVSIGIMDNTDDAEAMPSILSSIMDIITSELEVIP
ncbi:MAG: beta-lactamase family protein [Gammaproteobacteria bacterium]|nr:beta-lactamase family protein [Gammaproteobacteria bacterium]